MNVIKRNGEIKQSFLPHGAKVCVIGRVFMHNDGTNHVFAYDMIEDESTSREFEIKFKKHLLSLYNEGYLKNKITGELMDNWQPSKLKRWTQKCHEMIYST